MSEPTLDQIAPGGFAQLGQSPAGLDDATFDSLFPAEPSQAIQPSQQVAAKQDPQTTQQDQFFLKGGKSVYKTAEEAVKGLEVKDTLIDEQKATIEQLRQRYALTTG